LRLEVIRKRYTRTTDIGRTRPDADERLNPDSREYLEVMLANAPADKRDALEEAWEEMRVEEADRCKRDAWGRLRVELPNEIDDDREAVWRS
jgi:hypothetical protein